MAQKNNLTIEVLSIIGGVLTLSSFWDFWHFPPFSDPKHPA